MAAQGNLSLIDVCERLARRDELGAQRGGGARQEGGQCPRPKSEEEEETLFFF